MSALFEELASSDTDVGTLSLRRRWESSHRLDVYEVKLGDEFLMSSLFTVAEIELARLGLARTPGDQLDVVVGGLGLGYTARAVLEEPRVRSMTVIDALHDVIDWHERDLLPDAVALTADPRTRLLHGDFFQLAASDDGFTSHDRVHAVLVDIDHTPHHVLDERNRSFYTPDGLRRLARHLHPGGVFALWSDDPPDTAFQAVLEQAFAHQEAHVVSFPNFYTGDESANTVYVATRAIDG